MHIKELLESTDRMRGDREKQDHIDGGLFESYCGSVAMAYENAGLDPLSSRQQVPGFSQGDHHFQVDMLVTERGLQGSHFLIHDTDESHVDEVDLFIWNNVFDVTSGRLKTPEARYLSDYHLTPQRLHVVTNFIIESCTEDVFAPVPHKTVLSLPQ